MPLPSQKSCDEVLQASNALWRFLRVYQHYSRYRCVFVAAESRLWVTDSTRTRISLVQ